MGNQGMTRTALCAAAIVLLSAPVAWAGARESEAPGEGLLLPGPRSAEGVPTPRNLPQRADNLEVVGRFEVPGVRPGQIADVAVHEGYAYLNSWDDPDCEGGGTYVVDIRNPRQPREVAFIPAPPNLYHGEGAHVVSIDVPGFEGDVLAVNDETYGSNVILNDPCAPADTTHGGFDLYDVSDPANPVPLVRGAGDRDRDNDPATPQEPLANSYHSVFVWQDGPRAFLVASDNIEGSDVDIFDITNPREPEQVGDFDLSQEFPQVNAGEGSVGSNFGGAFLHDMVVKHVGGRPILKADYWDAGYVQLDVSDPAQPIFVNDTTFAPEDPLLPDSDIGPEGNAHQGEFSFDNQFLLAADEDFSRFRGRSRVLTGPGAGNFPAAEPGDTATPIANIDGRSLNGPTRFVGHACGGEAVAPPPAGGLEPGEEHIALIQRGDPRPVVPDPDPDECSFANKIAKATAAGWDGYVVFNQPRPDDNLVNMATQGAEIPGVHMRRVDALAGLFGGAAATPPIGTAGQDFEASVEFDGWGYAHLYDARTGQDLAQFAIPEGQDERFATGFGDLTIHEFTTDPTEHLAYSAYYAGGIRVFQYGRAIGLKQTGAWIARGGSNFWGVEQFTAADGTRMIAGSDRDFGLVLLKYTGPGAPAAPSCSAANLQTETGKAVRLPLSCADVNGNPLTRRVVQGPSNGTLGRIEGDSVLYTPKAGFVGRDTVRFVANDGAADSRPATAAVVVTPAVRRSEEVPSNKVGALRLGKYRNGRVVVTARVPGPGRLRVALRADVRRGRASAAKLRTLASRTMRPKQAGSVRVVLRLSKAERRALARTVSSRRRVRATIAVAFTPTGGFTGATRRTLVIRR